MHNIRSAKEFKRRSLWADVWKRLRKNKSAVAGMVLFAIVVIVCFSSPLFFDFHEDVIGVDVRNQFQSPSRDHPFGTDELGRSILARILWGGRTTILAALCSLLFAFVCGSILGVLSAYYGRFAETIIMRLIDIFMAIPPLLLMITLSAVMRPNMINLVFAVGFGLIPPMSRLIRGQVLQIVENEFIEAVRIQGAGDLKIIVSHIFPNSIGPVITTIILDFSHAVMVISAISFLGMGVQPPNPEWGSMLAGGREFLRHSWHIATFPGIALVITLVSLTLVGDGLRDALDPKMKR